MFRTGDPFDSLYAVRSGSIKTVVVHDGGREQVTGLMLAGDALGLHGIGDGAHTYDAIALEDSSVCASPLMRCSNALAVNRTRCKGACTG